MCLRISLDLAFRSEHLDRLRRCRHERSVLIPWRRACESARATRLCPSFPRSRRPSKGQVRHPYTVWYEGSSRLAPSPVPAMISFFSCSSQAQRGGQTEPASGDSLGRIVGPIHCLFSVIRLWAFSGNPHHHPPGILSRNALDLHALHGAGKFNLRIRRIRASDNSDGLSVIPKGRGIG